MPGSSASEFFDSYAGGFNELYDTSDNFINRFINHHFRKDMRIRYEKSIDKCQPIGNKTVIDVGCGPGHYSVDLASQGAKRVVGVDFSEQMIEIAQKKAQEEGVESNCEFICQDFLEYEPEEPFDYAIVTGVMDYIRWARHFVQRVVRFTNRRAMFSFPGDSGLIELQRKIKYKFRCPLYQYSRSDIQDIFEPINADRVEIDKMTRGHFVTVHT